MPAPIEDASELGLIELMIHRLLDRRVNSRPDVAEAYDKLIVPLCIKRDEILRKYGAP